MGPHPSHVTRFSDSSTFDEICINCGARDEVPGGWGDLIYPCDNPVGAGGKTIDEYYEQLKKPGEKVRPEPAVITEAPSMIGDLRKALAEAIKECEEHNREYNHTTKSGMINRWRKLLPEVKV